MIIRRIVAPVIFLFLASYCNNNNKKEGENKSVIRDSIPVCLQKQIEAFGKEGAVNPPLQIDEYLFKGKRVFLFKMGCCDQFNMLYDENCNGICAPSGGFVGTGDGRCKDFDSTATHVKKIWTRAVK